MIENLYVRARLALAVAARESADLAHGTVGDVSTPMLPGERIRTARRLRLLTLTVVDRAVLAELSDGTSWEDIGAALGMDSTEARRRYEPTWQQWLSDSAGDGVDLGDYSIGLRQDRDAAGTAEALDSWWRRHAEPWDVIDNSGPVAAVLSGPQ